MAIILEGIVSYIHQVPLPAEPRYLAGDYVATEAVEHEGHGYCTEYLVLGEGIDLPALERALTEVGIGFMMAPMHHPAMRNVMPARTELGTRTIFNLLGPLANPAGASRLMIGVADASMAERMAGVLAARGADRALVVHGDDGLDELTISTTSQVVELRDGQVRTFEVDPAAFGIERAPAESVVGGDPATNAALARRVLDGEHGPHRDIVTLNAGAALVTAGLVDDLPTGIEAARATIDDGRAAAALDRLIAVSNAA